MKANRARIIAVSATVVTALLYGCKSATPPTTQETIEKALPNAKIPMVWTEAAEQGRVPEGWLTSFDDDKMEAIVGEALKHNLALQAASARMDSAAGAARVAGASLKPVVGAAGGGNTADSVGAGLGISWELDVWGRLRAIAAAGQANYEGAQLDYEFARQSLAAQAAKSYFLVIETLKQLKLTEENVQIYQKLLDTLEARAKVGKVGAQDTSLAKADLASANERRQESEAAHKEAVRSLEVILGRYPSAELKASEEYPKVPPPPPAGMPSEILERRPDVAAAERRVLAAFQELQVAQLAKLPKISLSAAGGGSSGDLGGLLSGGSGYFGVGANFLAPIYTGGRLEAEIDIATAEQKGAVAEYGQTALVAFTEVENSLSSEQSLKKRADLLQSVLKENENALKLRKLEYDAGKADLLDVLNLQAKVNEAKSAVIYLHNLRLDERINLHLALGGSFEVPPPATQPSAQPTAPSR